MHARVQVCAKLSALTDELWRAGDPVLKNPTAHTVRKPLLVPDLCLFCKGHAVS